MKSTAMATLATAAVKLEEILRKIDTWLTSFNVHVNSAAAKTNQKDNEFRKSNILFVERFRI